MCQNIHTPNIPGFTVETLFKMFVSNTKNANVSDLTYGEFSNLITILTQVMAVGRISLAKLLISVLIVSKEGLGM